MTYSIYRTSMGASAKEEVRSGFLSLAEAVESFKALKGEAVVHLELDDENNAYDALVARAHIIETWSIEAA